MTNDVEGVMRQVTLLGNDLVIPKDTICMIKLTIDGYVVLVKNPDRSVKFRLRTDIRLYHENFPVDKKLGVNSFEDVQSLEYSFDEIFDAVNKYKITGDRSIAVDKAVCTNWIEMKILKRLQTQAHNDFLHRGMVPVPDYSDIFK